jgi:hypothetical protein
MVVFVRGVCTCGGVLFDDAVGVVVSSGSVCVSESVFCSVWSTFSECGSESTSLLCLCMYRICRHCA